jgi:hypothetical protein
VKLIFAFALLTVPALAQQFELGGSIGYGIYRNGTIFGPGTSAKAGIRDRFATGAVVGEDMYNYISGEFRYTYQDGHPFLSSGGVKSDIQGQSHALTYDFLFHLQPRNRRLRLFAAAGAGGKDYVIVGPAPFPQPLAPLATLTTRDEWKFTADFGGGVKFRLSKHAQARVDFRDYLTGFPKLQIAPTGSNTARGIFQQFTPLFGLSYLF